MDIGTIVSESIEYSKDALVGKWMRWAIFILLALPFSLVQFVFDPKKFEHGAQMDWAAVPWGQVAILFGLGLILSFFLSGYMVRVYRGEKPAPDFTGWATLFVDGVKLTVVWFLWMLPLMVGLIAGIVIAVAAYISSRGSGPDLMLILLVLLVLLVELILFVITILFATLGAVRFSRTGSIREGIRYSGILATISTMGWISYITALVVFAVACVIFAIVTVILGIIPYLGWVLVLIVTPFFTVFSARFIAVVYDQGEPQMSSPAPVPVE